MSSLRLRSNPESLATFVGREWAQTFAPRLEGCCPFQKTQEILAILELARQGDEDVATGRTRSIKQAFSKIRKEIRKKNPESQL